MPDTSNCTDGYCALGRPLVSLLLPAQPCAFFTREHVAFADFAGVVVVSLSLRPLLETSGRSVLMRSLLIVKLFFMPSQRPVVGPGLLSYTAPQGGGAGRVPACSLKPLVG